MLGNPGAFIPEMIPRFFACCADETKAAVMAISGESFSISPSAFNLSRIVF